MVDVDHIGGELGERLRVLRRHRGRQLALPEPGNADGTRARQVLLVDLAGEHQDLVSRCPQRVDDAQDVDADPAAWT